MEGWIKIYRSIIDHRLFDNPKLLKVWIWCLAQARHKPGDVICGRERLTLREGQFIFGRKRAAERLGIPESTVWAYMKMLKDDGSINIRPTSKYSIITVINWGHYQGTPTGLSTANEQQTDTNKNVNNYENRYVSKNMESNSQKQRLGNQVFRRGLSDFDPYSGSRSSGPKEEEKETIVPQLKADYQKKLAEYMMSANLKTEDKIDYFDGVPTETEYVQRELRKIKRIEQKTEPRTR